MQWPRQFGRHLPRSWTMHACGGAPSIPSPPEVSSGSRSPPPGRRRSRPSDPDLARLQPVAPPRPAVQTALAPRDPHASSRRSSKRRSRGLEPRLAPVPVHLQGHATAEQVHEDPNEMMSFGAKSAPRWLVKTIIKAADSDRRRSGLPDDAGRRGIEPRARRPRRRPPRPKACSSSSTRPGSKRSMPTPPTHGFAQGRGGHCGSSTTRSW